MMTRNLHRARFGLRALVGLAIVALLSTLSTGCFESSPEAPTATFVADGAEKLSISELRSKVEMSAEQATVVSQALDEWLQTVRGRQQSRQEPGGRFGGPNGGQLVPPVLEFLAECAEVLDHDQLVELVGILREQQMMQSRNPQGGEPPARTGSGPRDPRGPGGPGGPAGPGGGMGPRGHGDPLGALLGELDLNEQQRADVRTTFEQARTAAGELCDAFAAGDVSEEELRTGLDEIRAELETALAEILTAEQYARLQELKAERLAAFMERVIEKVRAMQDHHMELLARILGLDEQQQADIAAVHTEMLSAVDQLLENLRNGNVAADDMHGQLAHIRDQAHDDIRALLNPEQAELFDAILELLPPRGMRCPRP